MFIGHLGAGLALKRATPALSLGSLFLCVMLLDLVLGIFLMLGGNQAAAPGPAVV